MVNWGSSGSTSSRTGQTAYSSGGSTRAAQRDKASATKKKKIAITDPKANTTVLNPFVVQPHAAKSSPTYPSSSPDFSSMLPQNTTNPFQPNFSGQAPEFNPVEGASVQQKPGQEFFDERGVYIGGAPEAEQKNVLEGVNWNRMDVQGTTWEQANAQAYNVINGVFDIIENLGDGDFGRGIGQIITLPLSLGGTMISGKTTYTIPNWKSSMGGELLPLAGGGYASVPKQAMSRGTKIMAESTAGVVTKSAVKSGGSKSVSTIKSMVSKIFTKDKIIRYVDDANRLAYKNGRVSRITPWNVIKAVGIVGGVLAYLGIQAWGLYKEGKGGEAVGSRDVMEELGGMGSMYYHDMNKQGDPEAAKLILDITRDALSDPVNFSMAPGKSALDGTLKYAEGANKILDIVEEHYNTMEEMGAEGMNPQETADFWQQYNDRKQEKITAEANARVDYFNTQKAISLRQELDARAASRAADNATEKRLMEEQAAFWLKYRKELAKLEEEERIKQAEFWFEYKKMVLELEGANRSTSSSEGRSQLGFGLLG